MELIRRFSVEELLPVDIENHVIPAMRALGVQEKIFIYPDPKLNPNVLRGDIKHWDYPFPTEENPTDATPMITVRCADITYSTQEPPDWQRLICCKELLHVLDPAFSRVASRDQVERLIEKVILPPDLQDPFTDGIHAVSDRVAATYAAAVLFPMGARNILHPHVGKRLKLEKVAEMAELPLRYVALVMSDFWPEIHECIVNPDWAAEQLKAVKQVQANKRATGTSST